MTDIAALVPHAGAMVLLDSVLRWDPAGIVCQTASHLNPDNPLRHRGRLSCGCGIEYALQAAALHGALRDGGRQPAGYVASLRGIVLHADWLDDPALGALQVEARVESQEQFGMVYALSVRSASGAPLLDGRASIALPR